MKAPTNPPTRQRISATTTEAVRILLILGIAFIFDIALPFGFVLEEVIFPQGMGLFESKDMIYELSVNIADQNIQDKLLFLECGLGLLCRLLLHFNYMSAHMILLYPTILRRLKPIIKAYICIIIARNTKGKIK
jgi:hypothetical protein